MPTETMSGIDAALAAPDAAGTTAPNTAPDWNPDPPSHSVVPNGRLADNAPLGGEDHFKLRESRMAKMADAFDKARGEVQDAMKGRSVVNDVGDTGDDSQLPAEQPVEKEAKKQKAATDETASSVNDSDADDLGIPVDIGEKKKAEPPKADTEPLPEAFKGASKKVGEEFKTLRTIKNTIEAENAQIKAKLAEYETKLKSGDNSKTIQELNDKIAAMHQAIAAVDVTQSPLFKEVYGPKEAAAHQALENIAGKELAQKIKHIMIAPPSVERDNAIEEAMLDLPALKQARAGAILAKIDEINAEKQVEIEKARVSSDMMKAQREQKQQENIARVTKNFESLLTDKEWLKKNGLEVMQQVDGNAEWNTEVEERMKEARSLYLGQNDEKSLTLAAARAVAMPKLREIVIQQGKIINKLREQLGGMKAASPSMARGNGRVSNEPKRMSFAEKVGDQMGWSGRD